MAFPDPLRPTPSEGSVRTLMSSMPEMKSMALTKRTRSSELVRFEITTGFLKLIWQALDDLMLKILIVAAIISIVIEMIFSKHREIAWMEGAAILMAVVVVTLVTAVNDYKKESQFIALNKFSDSKNNIVVIRGGQDPIQINIDNLKTGDIA